MRPGVFRRKIVRSDYTCPEQHLCPEGPRSLGFSYKVLLNLYFFQDGINFFFFFDE